MTVYGRNIEDKIILIILIINCDGQNLFFLRFPFHEPVLFLFIWIALIKPCDWPLVKHTLIFLFHTIDFLNFLSQVILSLLFLFNFHLFLHNPPSHLFQLICSGNELHRLLTL